MSARILSAAPYIALAPIACLAMTWVVLRPPARLRRALEATPILWGSLAGGTVGGMAAVIINDSGMVAAAAAIGMTASALAYLALEKHEAWS